MQKKYNRFKEIKNYKKEKRKKGGKKRKTLQNCKSPTQRQRFITTMKSVTEYTHTHIYLYAKSKQLDKNKVQQIDPGNEGNQKLYLTVKNKTN